MRFTGTLKTWNDARGFGFIESSQGGQDLFVHIKEFPAGTGRPVAGQVLTFEVATAPNGKKQARAVQYPRPTRSRGPIRTDSPAPWTPARALAIPAFISVLGVVAWRWGSSPALLLAYVGVSLATFIAYAIDKSAARAGRWRTPEKTLHLLALAGGWPGALLAQQLLRHKTNKPEFNAVFWITVTLNVAAFVAWSAGMVSSARLPGAGG